jgi:hypothetical protein
MRGKIRVNRVEDAADRAAALSVLRATYQTEKGWIRDAESQIADSDVGSTQVSWFLASYSGEPAGVLRVHYAPPLEQYGSYGMRALRPGIDVTMFLHTSRPAEIGRFAIVPGLRRNLSISVALMRAATRETVERGFTHYITDVFENDPHSPYGFHTRVMGFDPVATHDHGELQCTSRRITMVLDLKAAYQRLRCRRGWIFRALTADWDAGLHQRLAV